MTINRVSLLLSMLTVSSSLVYSQQTSPTLEETGAFLTAKINGSEIFHRGVAVFPDGSQADKREWITQSFSVHGCKGDFVIHVREQQWDDDSKLWGAPHDLDWAKGSFDATTFQMTSSKVFLWYEKNRWDPPAYQIGIAGEKGLAVIAPDEALAKRLFNAFNGLAMLCGAKKEAY